MDLLAIAIVGFVFGFSAGLGSSIAKWLLWQHCATVRAMIWAPLQRKGRP